MSELEILQKLTGAEYRVYCYILYWREKSRRDGIPHHTLLQDKLGLCRATAFNIVRQLKAKDMI